MQTLIRFTMSLPGIDRAENGRRHQAMLDMVRYANDNSFNGISLSEHHGSPDGWMSSPMILAGLILGAAPKLSVTLSALLVPLHDPLRIAEDIAALDLASGGRFITIAGIGYRPEEYAAHGKDWAGRGALMDECIDTILKAWTGEPFEFRGTTVQVTPVPSSNPHPLFMLGGTSKVAVRRAARFGLPFMAAAQVPGLSDYYNEQCAANGTSGFFIAPAEDTAMVHVSENPDKDWDALGSYFLQEAQLYHSWQTPDIHSAAHSLATTVDELRAEGKYKILTPDECVAECKAKGPFDALVLHPLCGGLPVDDAWSSVRLTAEAVLPELQ